MKLVNTLLICLSFICANSLFANDPNDAYISGPTRVMAGLQNVRYTLRNFDCNNYIYCVWYFEDTVSHTFTSNVVYCGQITTTFDMPIAQTAIFIDVEVYFYDRNLDQIVMQDYVIGVTTFFITLANVRSMGLDGNYYDGLEENVPIHYNINRDAGSIYSDYKIIYPINYDDNDLLPITFELVPPNVEMGDNNFIEIEVAGAGAKLWTSKRKSGLYAKSGHNYLFSDPDLYSIAAKTFYVEACAPGTSSIKIFHNGGQIGSISYNAYAVTDGTQPSRLEQQYQEYQSLVGCEWSFVDSTVNPVSSYFHSSLAYAVDPDCVTFGVPFIVHETTPRVVTPTALVTSNYCGYAAYYTNVDAFCNANNTLELNDLISFFTAPIWPSSYDWLGNNGDIILQRFSRCKKI
jgi:hypothetical protein